MGLKYHKIFTHDHINARELSEVYTSDSSDHGRLFIILELPKQKIDQQPYIDQLINEVATYFDTSHQENPETLLEELLQQINQLLPEMSSAVKIPNWINTLDLSVGIIYNNNVYMAGIGNVYGILIHSKQLTTIMAKNSNINPHKIFADIISGELDDGDALIVSTESLFDYISKEKIKQLTSQYAPSAAAIKINELLETVPDFVTFNSLIIKKSAITDRELTPEEIKKPIDRDDLEIKDTIKPLTDQNHPSSFPRTKTVVDLGGLKNVNVIKKTTSALSLIGLYFKTLWSIFSFIGRKIKFAWLFVFSAKFRKNKEEKTIDNIKEITNQKYYWFKNLSTKKKIGIIMLFVVILIFLQSLVFLTQEKADDAKNENFDKLLVDIQTKYQDVEAKLIYNDEQAAENILLEIERLIAEMVPSSPDQQTQIDKLSETLFHKINDVRHIRIASSLVGKDLSSNILNAQDIVQKEGVFYILADNKLYKIKANFLENTEQLEEIFNFAGGQVAQSMTDWPEKNRVVVSTLSATNEISYTIFDLDKKQIIGDLKQNSSNTSVKDLVIYGNNLYVLDDKNKQIFKYPESGTSFANGQPWLKEEVDTSQSSSITIDGSVYLIANDGKIQNFIKGSLEPFDYHVPRPIIGPGAIIKTFRDSNYLYIIDPENYRVIILDKDGNIKDQYASQKFDALKDLAVDPDEKAIYLLNNQQLYILPVNE